MKVEGHMEGWTSYTVRGLQSTTRQPVGMATVKDDPKLAFQIAKVFQAYGLLLEIFWAQYHPTAVPGEQGTLSIQDLEKASKNGQA